MSMSLETTEVNHVERTIDEATFRIGQLQDLVKGLHLLREWSQGNGTVRNHELREVHENGKEEPKKKAAGAAVQTSGRAAVPNGIGKRVEGVIEELVGEFDAGKVWAELPGAELVSVNNALRYLGKQGKIEVVTAGRPGHRAVYRQKGPSRTGNPSRTGTVMKGKANGKEDGGAGAGGTRPALMRKPSAEEVAGWQDELEGACQVRDGHRAAGREGLAEVEQKKVDRLVALIQQGPQSRR